MRTRRQVITWTCASACLAAACTLSGGVDLPTKDGDEASSDAGIGDDGIAGPDDRGAGGGGPFDCAMGGARSEAGQTGEAGCAAK